ncbi:Transcriptional regulator [Collimonas arenae]|uniref:Transcriptional regulator n=1 Tax=Collimonas arenae TaxID=279058 RepID=A0A0A1F9W8_9BURK|nr:TetR/AcrR family transcriptional regulator [Collimonas arenae]AIY40469.1 Transcriptional regulator [Collimonas arenae]
MDKTKFMSDTEQKSASVQESVDLRSRRTRHHIDHALTKLLLRRSYDAIRVSDITKKAEIGRGTFYAHFDNKDELLRKQLTDVLSRFISVSTDQLCLLDATMLFTHLRDVPQMYQSLMSGASGPGVLRMAQEILEQRLHAILEAREELPPSLHAHFVSASLFTVLAWWTENGMQQSPSEMQSIFAELSISAFTKNRA